jgi:glucose-6-phosphate 1-dehydrogenase
MTTHTILLFGASGDLAMRKLIPALHEVMKSNAAVQWRLIGVARDVLSAAEMMERAKHHVVHYDEVLWKKLCDAAVYVPGDFNDATLYTSLAHVVGVHNTPLLVYCATSSEYFVPITQGLVSAGIMKKQSASEDLWQRIAYEKPFGTDAASAHALNDALLQLLSEGQIFRIDHYAAKKGVISILGARILDPHFNEVWQAVTFKSLQIVVNEQDGIGLRGGYYDDRGALQDMIQSHLLQFLALITVHEPILDQPYLGFNKAEILAACTIQDVLLGQYAGYRKEPHVTPRSKTETFVAARVSIDLPRWKDVAIFLKTGKKIAPAGAVMYAVCTEVDQTDLSIGCVVQGDNSAAFISDPALIREALQATTQTAAADPLRAYGRILEFMIEGEKTFCLTIAEIAEMWRIVDAVSSQKHSVHSYKVGSAGPDELAEFSAKHGIEWII